MRALANTVGSPALLTATGPYDTLLVYPMRLIDLGVIEREILRAKSEEFDYPVVDRKTNLKIQTEVARQTSVPLNILIREARTTYLPLSLWLSTNNRPSVGAQVTTHSAIAEMCSSNKSMIQSVFKEVNGLDMLGLLETRIGPLAIQYTHFLSEREENGSPGPRRNGKRLKHESPVHKWGDWRSVIHSIMKALHCLPTDAGAMTLPQIMFTIRMYEDKIPKADRQEFKQWQKDRGMTTETQKEISDSVLRELSMRLDGLPSLTS